MTEGLEPLPFEPESIAALKAKFPFAIQRIWPIPDGPGDSERPGRYREYIFDFQNGLRMIISKDMLRGKPEVHVSVSTFKSNFTRKEKIDTFEQLQSYVIKSYRMLGGTGQFVFIGWSEKYIPHWVVENVS